jgi:hypothetical protein
MVFGRQQAGEEAEHEEPAHAFPLLRGEREGRGRTVGIARCKSEEQICIGPAPDGLSGTRVALDELESASAFLSSGFPVPILGTQGKANGRITRRGADLAARHFW